MSLRASVVVATQNRADRLAKLLDALERQTMSRGEFEVVVVDTGSTDDTQRVLSAPRGELNLIRERMKRAGAAAGRERGWRRASGTTIVFTDDDCEPTPRWLETIVEAAGKNGSAFVQGRTLPNPAEADRIGPFSRTIRIEAIDVNYNTCNIAYPRDLLVRIDGFDTETFGRATAGGEDSDLAWRAILAGARGVFCHAALTYHAVNDLGPWGQLRVAARPMDAYGLHPGLRRATFVHGIFWKRQHLSASRAILALVLPRRWWPVSVWLAAPYVRNIWARGRVLGGGPALAPYYVLCDLVEIAGVLRSAVRYRTPMI